MDRPDEEMTTSASFTLKGELAQVFEDLFIEALRHKQVRTRAQFARMLIVAQLQAMGHAVEDDMKWGGYRSRSEASDEESLGDLVAVAAG